MNTNIGLIYEDARIPEKSMDQWISEELKRLKNTSREDFERILEDAISS